MAKLDVRSDPLVKPLRDYQIVLGMSQRAYDTLLAAMRCYQRALEDDYPIALAVRDEIASFSGRPVTVTGIDLLIEDWQTQP